MKNTIKQMIQTFVVVVCKLFPIKKNKIFFESYYGSQYGCNPKYLSEWIINHAKQDEFEVIWSLNQPIDIDGVRVVRNHGLRYFYELYTSKVIVTNFRTTQEFKKRKGQFYIQTWHSSLRLKQIEKDVESSLPKTYLEMAKQDSPKIDLLLSGCEVSTDIFKRAFWYDGEILEAGSPRNDLFFNDNHELNLVIKENLGISRDKKVLLYAPTFRKDQKLHYYQIEFEKVTNALKQKFNGDWICLIKLHPHLINFSKDLTKDAPVIDVTNYDDIQELLNIADVLISDYSSLIFDYALTKRPCFLYMSDYVDYTTNDRQLYFDILSLPFISTFNQEELLIKINEFNQEKYEEKVNSFLSRVGTFENGTCCEQVVNKIRQVCYGRD